MKSNIRALWMSRALLVLVVAVAAAFRFWQLDTIPPGFHYDEAYEGLEAVRVLTQSGYHPIFFPGNFGVEPLFIYLTSLAFALFGATPIAMRGLAALLGTLTVVALYGLGRELARADERIPPATPLLSALALAIMRWHVQFSRVGLESVLTPLNVVLLLWALWRGLRTNHWGAWVALGIAVGIGPYTYPPGRLMPLLALIAVAAIWLTDRNRLRGRWRGLVLAGAIAALVFAPLAWQWAHHPEQLLLRSRQIALGGRDAVAGTPLENLLATLGMFSLAGDLDPRNNVPGLPALDVLMSIPFYLGLAVVLWRWKRSSFGILLLSGLLMLAPTIFSEHAPHFRRAIGATPPVALLCGLGLATILGWRGVGAVHEPPLPGPTRKLPVLTERLQQAGRIIFVGAIVLGSSVLGATAYFQRWGHSPALFYAYDEGLWQIGQYVLGLPTDELVYVTPRPPWDMTLRFAWCAGQYLRRAEGESPRPKPCPTPDRCPSACRDVRHFDGREAFVAPAYPPQAGRSATYIVIEHEDFRGGRLLRELYPEAQEVRTFETRTRRVYARALRIEDTTRIVRQPKHAFRGGWPGMEVIGYDTDRESYRPGQIVYLQLWWHASSRPSTDWTVFTHLLGPPKADGNTLWAGRDARPGRGSVPTIGWAPGDLVLIEYQIPLPSDAPAGSYQIEMGLYDPSTGGQRFVTDSPPGQDHLILGSVDVL